MKQKELTKISNLVINASCFICTVKDSCAYKCYKDEEICLNYANTLLNQAIEKLNNMF